MDEEMKTLMRRNIELTRDNNKLLKKIRRNGIISNIMRALWIVIIIGIPFFLYQYILEPYVLEFRTMYQSVTQGVGGAQNAAFDLPLIGEALEKFFGAEESTGTSSGELAN